MNNSDHSTTASQKLFKVAVGYRKQLPTKSASSASAAIGDWIGLAAGGGEAADKAKEALFDERYRNAGCLPVVVAKNISSQRYLVSEAWGHIFVGTRESITRFAWDRGIQAFVSAEILNQATGRWSALERSARDDLFESLQHNDIFDRFEVNIDGVDGSDCVLLAGLPSWAAPNVAVVQPEGNPMEKTPNEVAVKAYFPSGAPAVNVFEYTTGLSDAKSILYDKDAGKVVYDETEVVETYDLESVAVDDKLVFVDSEGLLWHEDALTLKSKDGSVIREGLPIAPLEMPHLGDLIAQDLRERWSAAAAQPEQPRELPRGG